VRDILLGLEPKDFDIATDASPEEIKALFRNCRLIGRRFRLAHIVFGREVIEVATFRGNSADHIKHSDAGMILRDNHFGTIEQDAIRRDFTVNALYYDIADFSVHDYCNGMADLNDRLLRLIGDPVTRYQEDPVRMLRAVRLAVKLDLQLEAKTAAPIKKLANQLLDISSARLWDESHKLFLAGFAKPTFAMLEQYDLLGSLLPFTHQSLQADSTQSFKQLIEQALANTDQRIQQGKPLNPAFLFACFLWAPMMDKAEQLKAEGLRPAEAMNKAASYILNKQAKHIAIPKRFAIVIKEIWGMQHRLVSRRGKNLVRMTSLPRFRAAYDFLLLRAQAGEVKSEIADWWTELQTLDLDQQQREIKKLTSGRQKRRRPKRRPTNNQ
jgi:poly(A) polymerase